MECICGEKESRVTSGIMTTFHIFFFFSLSLLDCLLVVTYFLGVGGDILMILPTKSLFCIVEKKKMKYKYHEVFSAFPSDKILGCISWSDLLDVLSAKVVLIRQLQSWQWRPYFSHSQSKIKEYCQIWILVRDQITPSLIRHFGVVLKVENLSIFPALFNNHSLIWLFKVHPCIIILSYANIHSIEF